MRPLKKIICTLTILLLSTGIVQAERLKDLTSIAGVRDNQLLGYGLVVGLDGSGDKASQAPFTVQSLKSMLANLGVALPPNINPNVKNVAAVMVSAVLPPFVKPGQKIDITASSIGDAKSLRGGTLLLTPLKGVDGKIYAVAQGNLVVGGFGAAGADGSKITINIPSVGRIPNGATVERAVRSSFDQGSSIVFNLHNPDFTTANRLANVINGYLGPDVATPVDASSIRVSAPLEAGKRVSYLSMLENLTIEPGVAAAKVIVNSRTGTVVISQNVKVMPTAITHGSMTVTISESTEVSQPGVFGETAVVPQSDININQENSRMFAFSPGTDLNDIVRAVNQVGAAPGDLMAILEALKEAGALRAELIVI